MRETFFLDTAYAIALAAVTDALHERALVLAEHIEANRIPLLTTRAVLLEIGNSLSKQKYRAAAVHLLISLEQDPAVEIVAMNDELYAAAFMLFRDRADKEWGLVDCASFVVMSQRGITAALAADVHFEQAGFRALLRENS